MPDENHLFDSDLLPYGFQIGDRAGDGVIPQMRQKTGKAASRLIVEKDSESAGCETAVDFLIERSLSRPWPTVEVDDSFGPDRNSLRGIVLTLGNHRSGRQLPVLSVRVRNNLSEMRA